MEYKKAATVENGANILNLFF